MAVISVPGQGRNYNINIAGDTPTPEEQERINAFISKQGQPEPPADGGGFFSGLGTAFGVGIDQLQQGYGSALEGLGSVTGLEGLQSYGKETAEANAKEAAEGAQKLTGREDVDGLGSALSYFGETLAQNVPQLGTSLGGAYLGGSIGAGFGGFGAVPGAIIGGLAANFPFFYGQNRERQKEAIERGLKVEMDEGAAALAAIPQAALDAIVDRFMVGKFLSPEALRAGGLFTRAAKSGAAGVVTEVPTEVGQQIIERMQAGLPLDDEDAIREYEDAAIAAGLVGGTVGGVSGASSGDIRKKREAEQRLKADKELDADQVELSNEAKQRLEFGLAAQTQTPSGAPATGPSAPTLALPPPGPMEAPRSAPSEALGVSQPKPRSYGPEAYDMAVKKTMDLGRFSAPAIQSAIAKAAKTKVPMSAVREMQSDMIASGVLIPDTKATGGFRLGKVPENKSLEVSLQDTLYKLDESIRKDTAAREQAMLKLREQQQMGGTPKQIRETASLSDEIAARIEKAQATKVEVTQRLANAARAQQVPTQERPAAPVSGPASSPSAVVPVTDASPEAQAKVVAQRKADMQAALAQREERSKALMPQIKKMEAAKKKGSLPSAFEQQLAGMKAQVAEDAYAISNLKDQIKNPAPAIEAERKAVEAKAAQDRAALAAQSAKAPVYTGKEQKVFNALRKRLTNLGLPDVRLAAERLIRPDLAAEGNLIEGTFDVKDGNRVIALALSVNDPKMTDQQFFDALSEVMNHEVIHALKNMGLFSDGEWKSLSELARRQKYMKKQGGRTVERGYTYFDRAKRMYASAGEDIQIEEAIAEMFRDYVAGRLKVGGRPRSLMERIKGFFRGIVRAHNDADIDPNTIFEGIRFGEFGKRERQAAKPEEAHRTSRSANDGEVKGVGRFGEQRFSSIDTPQFKKWFGDSKVVDEDGEPRVVYHGAKEGAFNIFDRNRKGTVSFIGIPVEVDRTGFFFAEKEGFARGFADQGGRRGEVMPVYLSIQKPLDVTSTDNASVARLDEVITRMMEIDPEINNPDFLRRSGYDNFWELLDGADGVTLVKALRDLGYDGIKMIEPDMSTDDDYYTPDDTGAVVWVAFDEGQIKSVNNTGTFDPDNPDIRYSAIETENALRQSSLPGMKPVPVPGGDPEDIRYGYAMHKGRRMVVFLPEGNHMELGNGRSVGHGLAHIMGRRHDRELFANSDYTSVEHAIKDMLKRWEQQGMKDGEFIKSSPKADGIDLRWTDKRPRNAPVLRLGLTEHPGGLAALYVNTFFPELDVNKRHGSKSSMEQNRRNPNDRNDQTTARSSLIPTGDGDGDGTRRHQGGSTAPLEGAPTVAGATGPDQRLISVAEDYARSIGVDLKRQAEYARVDPDRAKRIASAYDAMRHDPLDPKVQEAYADLIEQTKAQYKALADAGYEFTFFDDETDPYAGNPWNAMRDLRANKKMAVYGTYVGFGTEGVTANADLSTPMLADTGIKWKDQNGVEHPVLANDLFRAVHDAFGHGLEGSGFRADGEENAWQAHVRLFKGPAVGALTSETRGQNSWLNFGPYGEQNKTAKVEDTVFAEQKIGLMPEWTWQEGRVGDMSYGAERRASMLSVRPTLTPEVKRDIGKAQVGMMYARSADMIANMLNLKGKGVRMDKARRIADGVLRRFQDSMLPVGRMVQELSAAGLTITDAMDPYLQEELMHGRVGAKIAENQKALFAPVVEAIKKVNVKGLDLDRLKRASNDAAPDGKGFADYMLKDSDSPRTALSDIYLYARHAKERNKFIRETRDPNNHAGSGMTDKEADAILTWFNRLDRANLDAFAQMETAIKAVVRDTNKVRLDAGLISQDAIEKNPFSNYVPLRGIYDPDGDMADAIEEYSGPPGRPRYGARGKEDPSMKGRFDYASDIVANIFTQNQNAILRGERNKVGQSFLNLLRSNTDRTGDYAQILDRRPTTRATNAQGKNVEVVDFQAIRAPDMLTVKEGGRETFVRFKDVRLAGAMNGQNGNNPLAGTWLIKFMNKTNRYLASINTSLNPEFMISNMLRDLQTAGVNVNQFGEKGITKDVMSGIRGALMGIRRSIRNEDDNSEWSRVYKDFVAAGGQNATNQFNSLSEEMAGIKKTLGDISDAGMHGRWNRVKHGFIGKGAGSLMKLVEDYNTVIENGVRVATYKALLDRGFTRERAAQAARNVTVNFAKGGDYRQTMGAMYLFYNASLQGSFALLNAAVRSPKVRKIWGSVIAFGILQDQLNAMLSDDDDDGEKVYDKIPSYVLEHNLILPDPFGITDRSYISIPMPYGLNMAMNAGRAMSRAARGAYDPSEAATSIFGTAIDALNPIGGTESFASFATPTVLDPVVDMIRNEDYAGKPIYKENLAFDRTPTPDSQMYWSTTSPSAIWIAQNLNSLTGGNAVRSGFADWSPDTMEFWFDYLTGGVGRFVQRTGELPFRLADGDFGDDLIGNVPFLRKGVGSITDKEDMGRYLEKASEVLLAGEELKQAVETGDAEWAKRTREKYPEELKLVQRVKSFETMLRKISKQMNEIAKNPRLAESQKRVLTDKLKERKKAVLSAANRLLADVE
ncbi:MAG: hypothetical protein QM805_07780 [Pseudomonas sp.]